ncbi:MAG: carboxypeptidase-like regulatory domain-containing protein [Planctomycetales bacterium]
MHRTASGEETPPAAAEPAATEMVRLAVRVVDTKGQPVSVALARVLALANPQEFQTESVRFDEEIDLPVGDTGELLTPPVPLGRAYVIQIDAPGFRSGLSHWAQPANQGTTRLPDVVLRRLLSVTGKVVGRDERPIAGVTVFQSGDGPERTEGTTDDEGQFTVPGVPEGTAFLFAEKEGFRFHGEPIAAENGPVQLVLEELTDPKPRTLRALPPPTLPLTRTARHDLAFAVLKPRLDEWLTRQPAISDEMLTRVLVHARFPAAISYLDFLTGSGVSPDERDSQIKEIAAAIVINDPDEALAMGQRMFDPTGRWNLYSALAKNLKLYVPSSPELDAFQEGPLYSEMAFAARSLPGATKRAVTLFKLACQSIQRGQIDETRLRLQEGRAALGELEPNDSAITTFNRQAAVIDALLDPDDSRRRLGEILPKNHLFWQVLSDVRFGRLRPVEAEELLETFNPADLLQAERSRWPNNYPLSSTTCRQLPEICLQMASVDPERAERMTERLFASLESLVAPHPQGEPQSTEEPHQAQQDAISDVEVALLKAITFARMAERMAKLDSHRALRLVKQAVGGLKSQRSGKYRDGWFYAPAPTMATLLGVADQLDPALAQELFWRTLSLRVPPLAGDGAEQRARDKALATLARLLSRYNLSVARTLLSELKERSRAALRQRSPEEIAEIHVDPEALLARARELESARFDGSSSSRESLRLAVAGRLSSVQTHIERDWAGYTILEVEQFRALLGFSFCHPRMD